MDRRRQKRSDVGGEEKLRPAGVWVSREACTRVYASPVCRLSVRRLKVFVTYSRFTLLKKNYCADNMLGR